MKYPKRKENKIKKLMHIISTSKNKISASEIAKNCNSLTTKQVAALFKTNQCEKCCFETDEILL